MANTYADTTGVLSVVAITPVIEALFGDLRLEKDEDGEGTVGFRKMAESETLEWSDIIDRLQTLAEGFGFKVEDDDSSDADADKVLWALAKHFSTSENEELAALIEQCEFEGGASYDALFTLATCFDDGHGLTALQYEGAVHCDRPRLHQFGGFAGFIGKECFFEGDSSSFVTLGASLDGALVAADTQAAAEVLRKHVCSIMAGFTSDDMRTAVRLHLSDLLRTEELEGTPEADMLKKPSVELLQRMVAESVFDHYDFGDQISVEDMGGWEWCSPGTEWTRSVFVRSVGVNVRSKYTFTIKFKPGSALIEEAYAIASCGSPVGSYQTQDYYIWTEEGDCQNKTGQLAEAVTWCLDFRRSGRKSYITNAKNDVFDLDGLLRNWRGH